MPVNRFLCAFPLNSKGFSEQSCQGVSQELPYGCFMSLRPTKQIQHYSPQNHPKVFKHDTDMHTNHAITVTEEQEEVL